MTQSTLSVKVTNLSDGETVHQRCLLITGQCTTIKDGSYISIKSKAPNGSETFPEQTWPSSGGHFKALVMLSPGINKLEIAHVLSVDAARTTTINVNYVPLLQNPPLHLVIMLAKDSPCMIDCPPSKAAGISSAHSDLDAAIAKFRMTAYMWQAFTANDLHAKGLGRRAFRLDEEWAMDTVSRDFLNARHDMGDQEYGMRSTARVHVIRSSKSVQEIRDANVAQQNPNGRRTGALFDYFMEALKEAGGPFTSSARPIVAGMILDSHFNVAQNLILGHAALGCHDPNGISLGMMGSHLVYAWPRFMEEVTACLTDVRPPGDKVGNDNGECGSMWEACTIGQGAHMHEVGHAFGLPHRPGIMERGYAHDWPKNFLSQTAYCNSKKKEGIMIEDDTPHDARWGDVDALAFRNLQHFGLPEDPQLTAKERNEKPKIVVDFTEEGNDETELAVLISAPKGVAKVFFLENEESIPHVMQPITSLRYTESELANRFDRSNPLSMSVFGYNGKESRVANVWRLLRRPGFVTIPGTSLRLSKRSVSGEGLDDHEDMYEWAQLLREKGKNGKIYRATAIDLRVGMLWDGGVVKYADGHKSHWGPMRTYGQKHQFGGHASEEITLPEGVDIARIQVNVDRSPEMSGVRMHLTDGTSCGELNGDASWSNIVELAPLPDEVIVGFYGRSEKGSFNGVVEFGIITAPAAIGLSGLPEVVFGMDELRNTAGMDEKDQDCHSAGCESDSDHSDGNDSDDTMDCDER